MQIAKLVVLSSGSWDTRTTGPANTSDLGRFTDLSSSPVRRIGPRTDGRAADSMWPPPGCGPGRKMRHGIVVPELQCLVRCVAV